MTRRPEYASKLAVCALLCGALLAGTACTSQAPRQQPARPPSSAPSLPTADIRKGDPDERFKDALMLMKGMQPDKAQQAFLALAEDFPEMSGALTNLGILFAQSRQQGAAVDSFSRAVSANPDNAVAWNWLGILYRERGDFTASEQAYLQALAARGDYAAAHLNLGILYDLSLRQPQQALERYRSYQQYSGTEDLIVTAWIKELEAQVGTAVASAGASP